jgi:hypothetical protein
MRKVLVALGIVQIVSNEKRHEMGLKRLGAGHFEAVRLNPYNPLSYVITIVGFCVMLLAFGFYGIFENLFNPFKWN